MRFNTRNVELRNIFFCIVMLLMPAISHAAAGFIVTNAQITKISSTSNNIDAFWVYYKNGQNDKCSGKVKFLASKAGTKGVFDRSFSLATTALVSQVRIDIYSYTTTADCSSAVSINLVN